MQLNLQELLQYKNDEVIARYQNEYPNSRMSAEEVFSELLKYIWLCHQHRSDKKKFPNNEEFNFTCVMHSEMEEIDNMWHTFILFTRDYQAFCRNYLNGVFFHHDPLVSPKTSISQTEYQKELSRYLSYIYDHLGEDTLIRWFNR